MEETISGQQTVKAYRQEEAAVHNFEAISEATKEADGRANFVSMIVKPATDFLSSLDIAIVGIVGGWLAIQGVVAVGTVVSFIGYSRQFANPMSQLSQLYNQVMQAIAGAEGMLKSIFDSYGHAFQGRTQSRWLTMSIIMVAVLGLTVVFQRRKDVV